MGKVRLAMVNQKSGRIYQAKEDYIQD